MHTTRPIARALAVGVGILLVLGATATAFASSEEAAHGPSEIPWNDVIEAIINFSLFVGILIYFLKQPVGEWLSKRSRSISSQLEEAARLREEAEEKLDEYQAKLDDFDKKREAILEGYREQGRLEKEKIIAAAKRQAERMREEAKQALDYEVQRAQKELRERVVDEAVTVATEAIIRRLDARTQRKLIDDYTEALKGLGDRASAG